VKHPRKYLLRLYVAGMDPKSTEAIRAITGMCDGYLEGRYQLVIVDIYQHPRLARGDKVIAAPTLIRKLPLPLRRVVGNMADPKKVLSGLGLRPAS
jgi:circadian clock protein KaiB